jgi:hypothetical protein
VSQQAASKAAQTPRIRPAAGKARSRRLHGERREDEPGRGNPEGGERGLGDSRSLWRRGDDVFSRSSQADDDDEDALRWAALERLPTHDRVRRAIVPIGLGGDEAAPAWGKGVVDVDVLSLGPSQRRALLERLVRVADEDNERFLLKLKDRIDR